MLIRRAPEQEKAPVAKLNNLSLTPENHMVTERMNSHKLFSCLHNHVVACAQEDLVLRDMGLGGRLLLFC